MIICKICGGRVSDQVACCARCFTPHHFDCWTFSGQCSIYGCGSKDHHYFDFRDKSEAEVLAAIGRSLVLAIKEDMASKPRAASGSGSTGTEGVGLEGGQGGGMGPSSTTADLVAYKRSLYRTLHAVLQKVTASQPAGDDALLHSFDEELPGSNLPALYLADELSLEPAGNGRPDLERKRELLHALVLHSRTPEPPGFFRRLLAALRTTWKRLTR